jgi:hypothetical protein
MLGSNTGKSTPTVSHNCQDKNDEMQATQNVVKGPIPEHQVATVQMHEAVPLATAPPKEPAPTYDKTHGSNHENAACKSDQAMTREKQANSVPDEATIWQGGPQPAFDSTPTGRSVEASCHLEQATFREYRANSGTKGATFWQEVTTEVFDSTPAGNSVHVPCHSEQATIHKY